MSRVALTDGSGRWFSINTAEVFKEDTRHDGRNWISVATDSQFKHERLFYTKGGKYILSCWSDYQGSKDTYEEITAEEAASWLVRNNHDPHHACEKEFAELEIA